MFVNWSIGHELYFDDAMNPTHEIFRKFTDIAVSVSDPVLAGLSVLVQERVLT